MVGQERKTSNILVLKMELFKIFMLSCGFSSCFGHTSPKTLMMEPVNYNGEVLYYQAEAHPPADHVAGAASGGRPGSATDTHTCDHIRSIPSKLRSPTHMWPHGLDYFYQKYTEAYGIPVLGSQSLSDSALQRACYVVRFVLADSYESRNSYYKNYGRFALMGVYEVTTHIPEHRSLGAWWDTRARGLGATRDRPVSTAGEENALCSSSDRYRTEDIVLHEFSHGAHLLGHLYSVNGFDGRLRILYNNARSSGLWANTYAMSTDREYLSEGIQSYFEVNAYANPPNGIHNHVNTRERLRTYDPGLYQFVTEIFPCGNNYIKRCENNRAAELHQNLTLNCEDGGGGGEGGDCQDLDSRCHQWAQGGYCTTSTWMTENCKTSCDLCDGGDGGLDCQDNNQHCDYWSGIGECRKNPDYMHTNCRRSCQLCT